MMDMLFVLRIEFYFVYFVSYLDFVSNEQWQQKQLSVLCDVHVKCTQPHTSCIVRDRGRENFILQDSHGKSSCLNPLLLL